MITETLLSDPTQEFEAMRIEFFRQYPELTLAPVEDPLDLQLKLKSGEYCAGVRIACKIGRKIFLGSTYSLPHPDELDEDEIVIAVMFDGWEFPLFDTPISGLYLIK